VLLASLSAMIGAATRAGATSLIASIVPVEALQAANAIHGVARNTVMVVATFGSAFAFIHFGIATALELDLATFVFAALAYQTYARRETPLELPEATGIRTVRGQLRWIVRNRVCTTLILSFAVATAAIGLFNATLPDFMAHHVGQSNGYGFALGFIGLGFAIGEGATAFIHRESVARRSVGLAFLGNAAVLWLLGHSGSLPTEFLALALLGMSDGTTEVVFDTLVQRATPQALQASVFALAGVLQNVGMVAGLLLAPLAVAAAGATTAVTLAAAGCAASALVAAAGLHSRRAGISAADSLHDELAGQREAA
jgi:predicted MFS family arabinose efflux permease